MMDGINLYSIDYYKKTVFKGSYRGLCFRIGRDERPASEIFYGAEGDPSEQLRDGLMERDHAGSDSGAVEGGDGGLCECLRVQAWKGPFILEKTDEEIYTEYFSFTDEGLNEANEWLEQKQKEIV